MVCNPNMKCSSEEGGERRKSQCGCDCIFECVPYYREGTKKKGEKRSADWFWTRVEDCEKHKEIQRLK